MTTAFELGCLSAMEKVAEESESSVRIPLRPEPKPNRKERPFGPHPSDPRPFFDLRSYPNLEGTMADVLAERNKPILGSPPEPLSSAELIARRRSPTPMVGSPAYEDPYAQDKLKGFPPFKNKAQEDPTLTRMFTTGKDGIPLGSPLLTPDEKFSAQFKQVTPARVAELKALYGRAANERTQPVAGGKYQSFAGLNPEAEAAAREITLKSAPKSESKSEPKSESKPTEQGGLMSYLKNPYVLGGLGIGALGLGGYGLYNHLNSKKKKKKESDSE